MISVKGQFAASISIGDSEVGVDQLVKFQSVASVGLKLPRCVVDVEVADPEPFLREFNDGKPITVSLGKDAEGMTSSEFKVVDLSLQRRANGQVGLVFSGLLNSIDILSARGNYFTPEPMSGIEAIQRILDEKIRVDAKPSKSEDSQIWYQAGRTIKKFVQNTYIHSRISNSALIIGFSKTGDLRIRSLADMSSEISCPDELEIMGNYTVVDAGGFTSTFGGQDQAMIQHDLRGMVGVYPSPETVLKDSELEKQNKSGQQLTFADAWLTDKTESHMWSDAGEKERIMARGVLTDNTSPDYWSSFIRNVSGAMDHSGSKVVAATSNFYDALDVLTMVAFKETETASGNYVVNLVSHHIEGAQKRYFCSFEMVSFPICKVHLND